MFDTYFVKIFAFFFVFGNNADFDIDYINKMPILGKFIDIDNDRMITACVLIIITLKGNVLSIYKIAFLIAIAFC